MLLNTFDFLITKCTFIPLELFGYLKVIFDIPYNNEDASIQEINTCFIREDFLKFFCDKDKDNPFHSVVSQIIILSSKYFCSFTFVTAIRSSGEWLGINF